MSFIFCLNCSLHAHPPTRVLANKSVSYGDLGPAAAESLPGEGREPKGEGRQEPHGFCQPRETGT